MSSLKGKDLVISGPSRGMGLAFASRGAAEIEADAVYAILTGGGLARTGKFLVDEDVLRVAGVTDPGRQAPVPGITDFPADPFLD